MHGSLCRFPRAWGRVFAVSALIVAAGSASSSGQGLTLALESVASGFVRPLVATHAGDGTGRLFVVEQDGLIRIVQGGVILATPFLNLSSLVTRDANEQGLLGLAFDPDFATNDLFYVSYTEPKAEPPPDCPEGSFCDANSVVARYQVSAGDVNAADPASAQVLFRVNQPRRNHNGGNLAFGPDGYLYISMGDGGGGGDPLGNAQDLSTLHGAILRIDPDGTPPAEPNDLCGISAAYGIPVDNPFSGGSGTCDEIWSYGLRNPWRFSFDRATGDLFIGDVGQGAIEEIDFQAAASTGGENYGWNCYEGSQTFPDGPTCSGSLVFPILEYNHDEGRSVTGGYRYRGASWPQARGVYFYADYVEGKVWGTVPRCDGAWESRLLLDTNFLISTFGEDEAGDLLLAEFTTNTATGKIHRLVPGPGSGGPQITAAPSPLDFGAAHLNVPVVRELTVTNTNMGPEATQISGMILSDPSRFSLDVNGGLQPCGSMTPCLSPGASCTVTVTFASATEETFQENLKIEGNFETRAVALDAIAYVPCSAEPDLVLQPPVPPVSNTRVETACQSITSGTYEILASGDVTFRAGDRIVIGDGLIVRAGAVFTAEIDPILALP